MLPPGWVHRRRRGYSAETFPGWSALLIHFAAAIPGLFTAVIIVGGVLTGIFTVTESGAFGTIYAFLVTLIVYRSLSWEGFVTAVTKAVNPASEAF